MLGFLEDLFVLIVTSVEYVFVFTALMFGFEMNVNRKYVFLSVYIVNYDSYYF